jgi:UDP-N-acetylmuramate--alanine ligase
MIVNHSGAEMTEHATLPPLPATIHLVGIGGIGVSGLARILLDRGYAVTGSDIADGPVLDDLRALGVEVSIGHDAANVGEARLVVTTAAARDTNPELASARERGIPVIKRAKLLGELASARTCIAVAGSHGKSTTSGMFALALHDAGCDPSYAVGAIVPQLGANAAPGEGPHFVVEADEYDYSFLTLAPDVALITNIEHDHPDLFPDMAAIDSAYQQFVQKIRPGGTLVLGIDDPGCARLEEWLHCQPDSPRVITCGRSQHAMWRLNDADGPARVISETGEDVSLALSVPGAHNRMNATMVLAASSCLGVDLEAVKAGLERFTGVGRRFDLRADIGGVRIFDDYAHHPTELRATIQATRERYPDARVRAIFQPHTYSRTRQLLTEFAEALDTADTAGLVEIYPARETDTLGVSSHSIAERMILDVPVYATPAAAAEALAADVRAGDVVLFLGAGDIWQAAPILIEHLTGRTGPNG